MASDEQPEPVTPKNLEHLFAGLTGSESDEVVDEKKEPQPKPAQPKRKAKPKRPPGRPRKASLDIH